MGVGIPQSLCTLIWGAKNGWYILTRRHVKVSTKCCIILILFLHCSFQKGHGSNVREGHYGMPSIWIKEATTIENFYQQLEMRGPAFTESECENGW
jgi:hypothetical protein